MQITDCFFILQNKDISAVIQTVDSAVRSFSEFVYKGILQLQIIQNAEIHFLIDRRDPVRSRDIDQAVLSLQNRTDRRGFKSGLLIPAAELSPLHQKDAALIGTDPQAVVPVHIEALHTCDPGGGVHAFKSIPVKADQPAVTADPDKTLFCLRDGVCLGSRKTVHTVIQHRRIPFFHSDRVDRRIDVQIPRGIQDLLRHFAVPARRRGRHLEQNKEHQDKIDNFSTSFYHSCTPCRRQISGQRRNIHKQSRQFSGQIRPGRNMTMKREDTSYLQLFSK